jgi:hypothetical protein
MMKHTLTAAALAVALATPAFAHTSAPSTSAPSAVTPSQSDIQKTTNPDLSSTTASDANFISTQQSTDWRGSKLIGATIYGSDNASIGEVNDLVLASDGKVNGVVIGVGGFLGVGAKNVAVPFDKLNVTRKPNSATIDKITVAFSKDELKNAPTFAFFEPEKSTTTGSAAPERPRGISPIGGPAPSAPSK